MRARLSVSLLLLTTVLGACSDNNKTGNDPKKDMTVATKDQGTSDEDLAEAPDMRRPRDLTEIDPNADLTTDPSADLATDPSADLAVDPNADLAIDPTADLATNPSADLTGAPSPDLTTLPDLLVTADLAPTADLLSAADMAPACSEVGTHDVKSVTISAQEFLATGTSTFSMPLGFLVNGDATLTNAGTLLPRFGNGRITMVNAFTGARYQVTVTDATTVGSDLKFSFEEIIVPAGTYYIQSAFFLQFEDGTVMGDYRTEPDPIVVCGDAAARQALVHPALPTLQARRVDVQGLAAAYGTPTIDPDGADDTSRLFHGNLYLESLDGRFLFTQSDSGYVDGATKNALKFENFTLPNSGSGFGVKATFKPQLLSTDVNGWQHTFRFSSNPTITAFTGANTNAFAPLVINAGDVVTISGDVADPNERLFKIWNGFNPSAGDYNYILHQANCHVPPGSEDIFWPQDNSGAIYTDIPNHKFPVKKGEDCDFFAAYRIRVPLATNAGATPSAPAQYSNLSSNDIFVLITPTESLPVDANTTKNLSVPNLSGAVARTIRARTSGGANIPNATVDVETNALTGTGLTGFGGRAGAVTNGSGQVLLNLLPGSYFVTITTP